MSSSMFETTWSNDYIDRAKQDLRARCWQEMWNGIMEMVTEGEVSRNEANQFIYHFNESDVLGSDLMEVPFEIEVRVSGRMAFDFETMIMMPVEPVGDETLDDLVIVQFERLTDVRNEQGDSMSISDVRVLEAKMEGDE